MTDNDYSTDDTDRERSPTATTLTYTIDDDESPSEAIVSAVATVTGKEILDLDPLYQIIDPDHLNSLYETISSRGGTAEIAFEFNNCQVTVTHEKIHVREIAETS